VASDVSIFWCAYLTFVSTPPRTLVMSFAHCLIDLVFSSKLLYVL
jgi:hypothetical protein